jgi:hypothetical protein
MADGILGRWSQRKQAVREGKPLEEPVRVAPAPAAVAAPVVTSAFHTSQVLPADHASETTQTPPPPTLEDVHALTPESDFSAFTGVNVSPEVSNAAMKKLFTDPHYNVMDGLDIYIDDYSKPDPLPLSMLRQMVSAQFLNLFDEEKDGNAAATVPHNPAASVKSEEDAAIAHVTPQDHAHPDLRLQPNDAASAPDPGRGTE